MDFSPSPSIGFGGPFQRNNAYAGATPAASPATFGAPLQHSFYDAPPARSPHRQSVSAQGPISLTDAQLQELYRQQDDEVHDYLRQLDELRQECERTGQFVKAQECINKMRDVNLRHAKKLEQRSHQANVDTKARLKEEHKLELLTFSRMWEEKIAQYDQNADQLVAELKGRHTRDFHEQEGILKVQLMNKRPRFSKKVMDLRAFLERCVQQRNYLEAEEIKKKLEVQEQYEIALFDEQLAVTFEKRIAVLKTQYIGELSAVEQKIKLGREEILAQRQIDFERLLKRHANVFKELDNETKLHIAKARKYIHRQVKAMVHDPLKTGMDLRGVSTTLREGQGKSFRSTSRAQTPPARGGSVALSRSRASLAGGGGGMHSTSSTFDDSRFEW